MANTPTKSWADIATKASDNSLTISLEESDGTYLVCGKLPEGVTSLYEAFSLGESLTDIVFTDSFDTSKVTDMSYMFGDCSVLTSITFSPSFDTSKVTDMSYMFSGCSSLTSLDLSSFEISNETNICFLFSGCTSLQNIKMPNIMNADSTIKLSDLSLPNDKSWYSLASGDSKGTLVADTNVSANTYAGHILTINQNKSYAEIDKIITNATKPSTPETPSTGVALDVVLPVASIVLVLASLVAVAFVGKKKKQF